MSDSHSTCSGDKEDVGRRATEGLCEKKKRHTYAHNTFYLGKAVNSGIVVNVWWYKKPKHKTDWVIFCCLPSNQVQVLITDENDCVPEFLQSIYSVDGVPETVTTATSLLQGETQLILHFTSICFLLNGRDKDYPKVFFFFFFLQRELTD